MRVFGILLALLALLVAAPAGAKPTAKQIVRRTLENNHWGMSAAKVQASAVLLDRRGRKSTLVFKGISRKWKGFLTKALVRFSAPPDLAAHTSTLCSVKPTRQLPTLRRTTPLPRIPRLKRRRPVVPRLRSR